MDFVTGNFFSGTLIVRVPERVLTYMITMF